MLGEKILNLRFPRGLAKLKEVFVHLREIRQWSAEDRIRETGLFEDWNERLIANQATVPYEAELWYRGSPAQRELAESYVSSVVESFGGEILQRCVIQEINYHAQYGIVPGQHAKEMMETLADNNDISLLKCDDVMYVRPVGQCSIGTPEDVPLDVISDDDTSTESPNGEPLIALFDGMPLTGHQSLDQRLMVDDPDGFEVQYQAHERVHGTAMSSLICLGDISEGGPPVDRKLYVRPIMKPYTDFLGKPIETIPPDILPVDLIHRAVRRLYEHEDGEPPAAETVRVINLSICDVSRPFTFGMSPLARLLDWLSFKYGVLFVVSAGNYAQDIELNVPRSDFNSLGGDQIESAVIEAVARRHAQPSFVVSI